MEKGESNAGGGQRLPTVVIAAPQGRSGKTTVSIGLCAALARRGLKVQPFKKGPDYIDPSWLAAATGRSWRSLDTFLLPEDTLLASYGRACRDADFALVEGAMGLYDAPDEEGKGSTARLARLLHAPVILVINTARMTRSVAAMVSGYRHFEPDTNVAGVILNSVSGSRHESKLRAAVERHCGIPVLGSIPRDESLGIPQRHLGIVPRGEVRESAAVIDQISVRLEGRLDLDAILAVARQATGPAAALADRPERAAPTVRIGVLSDRVFTFYYPENLEALAEAGAELVPVDSLLDQRLPDVDGLFIGGGFPELFLEELEANTGLRQDIARAIEEGLPVYAECAGLMYLCSRIRWRSREHEMVGVIPGEVEIHERPQGHGYVAVDVVGDNPFFPRGQTLRGHEFHYSRLAPPKGLTYAYAVRRGRGMDGEVDGIVYKNTFAAYTHLHALGTPQWARAFVSVAARERRRLPQLADGKPKGGG